MSQQFCLKWNNHMNNMMDVFKNLLSSEAMVDVTLACDGLSLKAHKIVLSACSPFFQTLFLENPCKHPIVILRDMKYTELKAIIEFMYHGEVNVAQEQLSALMKTAETLRVKGLAEVTNEKDQSGEETSHKSVSRTGTPPPKRRKGRTRKRSVSDQSDDGLPEPKIKQQPDSDIEELSSDMDRNTQYSTTSTVPVQSRTNPLHKSQVQQQSVEQSFTTEENYSIEAPKLLQQTLTTDDLPGRSGRSSVQSNMEVLRRPQSNIDHSSSLVTSTPMSSSALAVANQQPESPPDIKPELLDLEPPMSPQPGPSHGIDENSMMFMDQSNMSTMSEPSSFQDNSSLMPTDSQSQVVYIKSELEVEMNEDASLNEKSSHAQDLKPVSIKEENVSLESTVQEEIKALPKSSFQTKISSAVKIQRPQRSNDAPSFSLQDLETGPSNLTTNSEEELKFQPLKWSNSNEASNSNHNNESSISTLVTNLFSESTAKEISVITLPKFSPCVETALKELKTVQGNLWYNIIMQAANYYINFDLKTKNAYEEVGRLMYEKYPSIEQTGLKPWSRFTKALSQKIRSERMKKKCFAQKNFEELKAEHLVENSENKVKRRQVAKRDTHKK